jgi:class 3 adenylate cyclase
VRSPPTRYAHSGEASIAYQTLTNGAGARSRRAATVFSRRFDGPARAVRCAAEIVDSVATLGLGVRTGLHTGECELREDDVTGIAVHIASRVMHEATSGEVLTSSTVKDPVVGSGLRFADRGDHLLRGVPDSWRLYALER